MTMPVGAAGTYLVHFTGSAEHNVRLRAMARDRGWSLSEHGFTRSDDPNERKTFATEDEVYRFLGLPLIEVRAARGSRRDRGGAGRPPADAGDASRSAGRLPHPQRVVGRPLHDRGHGGRGARARSALPGPDRPQRSSLSIAQRPVARARRAGAAHHRRAERRASPARVPTSGCCTAASWRSRPTGGSTMTTRCWPDSTSSWPRSTSAGASHGRSSWRAIAIALHSPHVDIIAHPSGRKLGLRDDLDLDWDAFYREAAETRTVLELNGSDERLDLDDRRARAARTAGNRFVIDSDAHYLHEFDNLEWGVGAGSPRVARSQATCSTRCRSTTFWPRLRIMADGQSARARLTRSRPAVEAQPGPTVWSRPLTRCAAQDP